MRYTRLYADEAGESHFEDVEVGLSPTGFIRGGPQLDVSTFAEAKRFGFLAARPGLAANWHLTEKKQIFFFLEGESEFEVSDGEIRRFSPGCVVLVEDKAGKGHANRVVGEQSLLLAVVQLED